jgi:hypothetical protein
MPHPARALRMLFSGRHSRIRRAPLSIVVYSAIRTSSARVNLLMVKFHKYSWCVALVFADPGASFKMYLKNAFQVFRERKLL